MKDRDFFRDSAWLMTATVLGGSMMWGVHFLAKLVPMGDYAAFVALNAVLTSIPTMPLQMTFAQWSAIANTLGKPGQVATLLRTGAFWLFLIWLPIGIGGIVFCRWVQSLLKLTDPLPVVATTISILAALLFPVVLGVLQGTQRFLWFGLAQVIAGASRLLICLLFVFLIFPSVRGMMLGVLGGFILSLVVALCGVRDFLHCEKADIDWKRFWAETLPIVLAFAGFQFLFTADVVILKMKAPPEEQMACYGAAGVLARGLVWFVGPMAAVMFPRVVRHTIKSERSMLLEVTLGLTFLLSAIGAILLYFASPLVIKLVYRNEYLLGTTDLLPLYLVGMSVLALVNVLVNNLVASRRYAFVPFLLGVCGFYGICLHWAGTDMKRVLYTLLMAAISALGLCACFTWAVGRGKPAAPTA